MNYKRETFQSKLSTSSVNIVFWDSGTRKFQKIINCHFYFFGFYVFINVLKNSISLSIETKFFILKILKKKAKIPLLPTNEFQISPRMCEFRILDKKMQKIRFYPYQNRNNPHKSVH